MSDATVVNTTIELLRPLVENTDWIDRSLDESERSKVVDGLQRHIAHPKPGDPNGYQKLKQYYAAENLGSSVQRSVLREACFEIARSRVQDKAMA